MKRWLNIIGYGKISALGMLVETSEGLIQLIIGNAPSAGKKRQAQEVVIPQGKGVGVKLITWDRLILFVGGRSTQ
jgi:hypothetical protein